MIRFQNGTLTELRLVSGDVRTADDRLVVIGRDPELRAHYSRQTGRPFANLTGIFKEFPVQSSRSDDRSLSVFATSFRPRGPSRRSSQETARLQSDILFPLARMISLCDATEIAMVPLSCRAPKVIASGMVRMIWDISVAAFLDVRGPMKQTKPTRFTIYCLDGDLQPFIEVLDAGRYAALRHGWLFNTEVGCNRAKQLRFFAKDKFRFRPVQEAASEAESV